MAHSTKYVKFIRDGRSIKESKAHVAQDGTTLCGIDMEESRGNSWIMQFDVLEEWDVMCGLCTRSSKYKKWRRDNGL